MNAERQKVRHRMFPASSPAPSSARVLLSVTKVNYCLLTHSSRLPNTREAALFSVTILSFIRLSSPSLPARDNRGTLVSDGQLTPSKERPSH